jgi:membrane-associated phospholipid phosphatase
MLGISWAAIAIAANAAVTPVHAAAPQKPPSPPPPDRPIARLVQNLGDDLKQLPAVDTLVILGAGGAAAVVASNSDNRVNRWTLDNPSPSWTRIGRISGDGWTLGGAALGTWLIGEATHKPLVSHVGSDLIRVQVLNGVITRSLKIVVSRSRPSGGGHAFPSGHASAAFASAGVLQQHFGWKAGAPAFAAASFIGMTRVRDRMHWVSDAAFGAAIGLVSSRAVTRSHHPRQWAIAPTALPGGAGVVIIW